MSEKKMDKKRLKIWLEQRKNEKNAKNFNRKSHYNRDVCY